MIDEAMNRRTFLTCNTAGLAAFVVGADAPLFANDVGDLRYLTTAEYAFIWEDFGRRWPSEFEALRRHSWMVSDMRWSGEDGHYPDQVQLSAVEEDAFEKKHGFRRTYYWRTWLPLAKNLLKHVAPEGEWKLLDETCDVSIWIHQGIFESSSILDLYYVFHNTNSVAGVQWPMETKTN